jgi:hypothetical protein
MTVVILCLATRKINSPQALPVAYHFGEVQTAMIVFNFAAHVSFYLAAAEIKLLTRQGSVTLPSIFIP